MMPLYAYHCPVHGEKDIFHPMGDVGKMQKCPDCGEVLKRKYTPTKHWWPANYRPGYEDSAQRKFLDPEFRARHKDEYAREKEEHLARTQSDGTG